MWIAANFLLKNIVDHSQDAATNHVATVTTIDLGGASTQIAFKISKKDLKKYKLSLPTDNDYGVYSASYLGYGNDRARLSVTHLDEESPTSDI